jgi:hypothetical protein
LYDFETMQPDGEWRSMRCLGRRYAEDIVVKSPRRDGDFLPVCLACASKLPRATLPLWGRAALIFAVFGAGWGAYYHFVAAEHVVQAPPEPALRGEDWGGLKDVQVQESQD